ncbi:hypothetical protein A2Z67_05235 [Candidatus Woesebacteria bacterium RBG_13_36_22]|uniref:Uncharacterized protein n=1 Tax=Candidatus Woesebacteria bacterium RBG_13_36_22 TaxID=1802478 RepID=A0A1F7X2K9_9BACT|nr:MAG: hypothetical protein A2Z67_05235 [Candidatus Woesebacteria bacterium RBG_13_36_22]
MWLFTRDGFLSIVEHNDKPDMLIVRSRFNGHIERIFGDLAGKVEKDAGTDYEYRAEIRKAKVAEVIAQMVLDIDYGNFKNELGKLNKVDSLYIARSWATYEVVNGNYEA